MAATTDRCTDSGHSGALDGLWTGQWTSGGHRAPKGDNRPRSVDILWMPKKFDTSSRKPLAAASAKPYNMHPPSERADRRRETSGTSEERGNRLVRRVRGTGGGSYDAGRRAIGSRRSATWRRPPRPYLGGARFNLGLFR